MENIAVFASGNGTNAQNIIDYFNGKRNSGNTNGSAANTTVPPFEKCAVVKVVICNKRGAYVLERAKASGIPAVVLEKDELTSEEPHKLLEILQNYNISYIVLAGYLLKIPLALVQLYRRRIINIHPALLPKFGGKGMYGKHVHEAVIAAGEKESGITIHLVDSIYDNGEILFQAKCDVTPLDTPTSLADKVHMLEQMHFPQTIEKYIHPNCNF